MRFYLSVSVRCILDPYISVATHKMHHSFFFSPYPSLYLSLALSVFFPLCRFVCAGAHIVLLLIVVVAGVTFFSFLFIFLFPSFDRHLFGSGFVFFNLLFHLCARARIHFEWKTAMPDFLTPVSA